jgi:hypothetical protein
MVEEGGQRKKKGGGAPGTVVRFKNSRDLTIKLGFLTILYFK